MIDLLTFSKDRALQMDLLLQSMDKHCDNLFNDVAVLYTSSTPEFESGYEKLAKAWPDVRFIKETNFEEDTRKFLREASEIVCLLSDDCFFFRDVSAYQKQIIDTISREEILGFILGIGGDSRYSGTRRHKFRMPDFTKEDNVLIWDWQQADKGEFECAFMVCGCFYKRDDYLSYVDQVRFQNPNTFESVLQKTWQYSPRRVEVKKLCACLDEQKIVHSLNNRVQDIFRNKFGEVYPFSAKDMNEAYLSGKVVDLEALDFSEVDGLHKEIEFILRNEDE